MEDVNVFELDAETKKITAEQRRERLKDINDLRKVLQTPEGRRYLWRQLGRCGVFRNSFNPNSNLTAFSEGQRNIGLALLNEINEADIAAFAKMQNEYLSALKSKQEAKEAKGE